MNQWYRIGVSRMETRVLVTGNRDQIVTYLLVDTDRDRTISPYEFYDDFKTRQNYLPYFNQSEISEMKYHRWERVEMPPREWFERNTLKFSNLYQNQVPFWERNFFEKYTEEHRGAIIAGEYSI